MGEGKGKNKKTDHEACAAHTGGGKRRNTRFNKGVEEEGGREKKLFIRQARERKKGAKKPYFSFGVYGGHLNSNFGRRPSSIPPPH